MVRKSKCKSMKKMGGKKYGGMHRHKKYGGSKKKKSKSSLPVPSMVDDGLTGLLNVGQSGVNMLNKGKNKGMNVVGRSVEVISSPVMSNKKSKKSKKSKKAKKGGTVLTFNTDDGAEANTGRGRKNNMDDQVEGGTKKSSKTKKRAPSKYNKFMKCEMKRLKNMPSNKNKSHKVIFKMAAANYSK